MFARIKKAGKYEYLQIVENYRENKKPRQRVLVTLGRMDNMRDKEQVEVLIRSLARFSKRSMLVLTAKSDPRVKSKTIGPSIIFKRIWEETGIPSIIKGLVCDRKFEFDVEQAIFTTVLHRIMISGSDRNCDYWKQDYLIEGSEKLSLHHFYRAMSFLGEEVSDQIKTSILSKRRIKDIIEEELFFVRRDLFSGLEMVFFDTTSIHFEGEGGELGEQGHSKSHRPDLNQMIIGVLMDNNGMPLCCEMWPGNTADVTTFLPIIESIKKRFDVHNFCIIADRGMISKKTLAVLESSESRIKYILGVKMRQEKEVKMEVLSRGGRYKEVYPESSKKKDHSPLRVKEVMNNGKRFIVCLNTKQARKERHDREAILESLQEKLEHAPGKLIGNKGYRRYLKVNKQSVMINYDKIINEEVYDGKWVLRTNTDLPSDEVALKYKELWMIERIFRDMKSLLETRPVYHQNKKSICGHIFCSFLSLVLIKELKNRLERSGVEYEWNRLLMDLKALKEFTVEHNGRHFAVRTECRGICGKIFQSVGVSIPPTIREI